MGGGEDCNPLGLWKERKKEIGGGEPSKPVAALVVWSSLGGLLLEPTEPMAWWITAVWLRTCSRAALVSPV